MDFGTNKNFKQSMRFQIFVLLIFLGKECISKEINRCISKETCAKCIEEGPSCAWCSQEDFSEKNIPRCDLLENLEGKCSDLVYPQNSNEPVVDLELSNKKKGTTEEDAVQIQPQVLRIKLRPNTPETFSVHFRQAEDYPVDLYYVMDLSHSMKDDKDKLAQLGNKFAEEMSSITSNFRLGFGSFVDKVSAPYVAMHPKMLEQPCPGCASPYGFRNHMPLSEETAKFAEEVHASKVSGNLDSPEGTMDAIMQAVVCKDYIGWRNKSRKLLVVSTDNDYHYAGDGKLGGIITPNDCECHLDGAGFYTKSTEQDYPSLSQVNRKIKENNVNLIFAVTRDQVDHYRNLSRRLVGSTTGMLADDSSNVVKLIREQYEAISSAIEMTDTAHDSGNIEVTYNSTCLDGEEKRRNVCKGLKVLDTVTFNVTVKFSFCPENREKWNQTFQIKPVGLNEYLTVHLEMICECDCEKHENEERDSSRCSSGNGTFECGVCSCYGNKYGEKCECDGSENQSSGDEAECSLGTDEPPCSNRGECRCGKCLCNKRENPEEKYYGKHCECNNFSCDQVDQKMCNGHGLCHCGKCRCHKGWSGSDCSCSDSIQNCMDHEGKICGDKGRCVCSSCKCEDTYFGQFCDDCPSCVMKCQQYADCVECFLNSENPFVEGGGCDACEKMKVQLVDKMEGNQTDMIKSCTYTDVERCNVFFKYEMDENHQPLIYVQREKECPLPPNFLAIVSGTTGSIVVAGLLLLLMWKLLMHIHDKREYARFEKEMKKAKWDSGENPIYVKATSTFQNPAYAGK